MASVRCQRFFEQGSGSGFVENLAPAPVTSSSIDLPSAWQARVQEMQQTSAVIVTHAQHSVQEGSFNKTSSWLQRTQWREYLAGIDPQELLESIASAESRASRLGREYLQSENPMFSAMGRITKRGNFFSLFI